MTNTIKDFYSTFSFPNPHASGFKTSVRHEDSWESLVQFMEEAHGISKSEWVIMPSRNGEPSMLGYVNPLSDCYAFIAPSPENEVE